jgi:hypothetical protein
MEGGREESALGGAGSESGGEAHGRRWAGGQNSPLDATAGDGSGGAGDSRPRRPAEASEEELGGVPAAREREFGSLLLHRHSVSPSPKIGGRGGGNCEKAASTGGLPLTHRNAHARTRAHQTRSCHVGAISCSVTFVQLSRSHYPLSLLPLL